MPKTGEKTAPDNSFGAHLARLRNATGLSLREVEVATGNEVSNAYLSQLERNKVSKPSPNVLHALAQVYKTSYEDLMKRAGYLSSDTGRKVAAFAIGDLTAQEEQSLIDYLAFIRQQRKGK
jgi:transcriptional regulator with XRE-family HTH domain